MKASPQTVIANEWEVPDLRNVPGHDFAEVVNLVAAGKVKLIVTGRFPLEEADQWQWTGKGGN